MEVHKVTVELFVEIEVDEEIKKQKQRMKEAVELKKSTREVFKIKKAQIKPTNKYMIAIHARELSFWLIILKREKAASRIINTLENKALNSLSEENPKAPAKKGK